jgi:hypothetical protein
MGLVGSALEGPDPRTPFLDEATHFFTFWSVVHANRNRFDPMSLLSILQIFHNDSIEFDTGFWAPGHVVR